MQDQLYQELAQQYGTPLYVYDEKEILNRAKQVLAFQSPFGLTARYAMKANPNRAILRLYQKLGIQIDASSGFEATRAMLAGIPGKNILLTSQECPQNLNELINQGVEFNACSLHQLEQYAKLENRPSGLTVRINPGKGSGFNPRTDVAGSTASFEIWPEDIPKIHEICEEFDLKITRVHTHIGAGTDPEVWKEVAEISSKMLHDFPDATVLNLGGGFKVDRMNSENDADLKEISSHVKTVLENFYKETGRKIHLEIEPGTFLSAICGAILTRIQDITSTTEEHRFLKIDAGMTEILRPTMYGAQHPMRVIQAQPSEEKAYYYVVGHCCETSDTLTVEPDNADILRARKLGKAKIGDHLLIGGAGGYCSAMSAINYNSFPMAAEVLIQENGNPKLIRKRQTLLHMLENEMS